MIALLILALVAAGGALGVWYWQQREVNRLNDRIAQLESEQSAEANRLKDRTQQLESELAAAIAEKKEAAPPPQQPQSNEYISLSGVVIQVDNPEKNAKVGSPLKISGKVPGSWSFEASFPVRLEDGSGNVLAQAPAQLLGDWMTTELVPFEATLTFTSPGSGTGLLVLQKGNPSGLPEKDDSVSIPIKF